MRWFSLVIVAACGSSSAQDLCTKAPKCSSDPPRTTDVTACNQRVAELESEACWTEYLGKYKCIDEQTVCGTDQKTDANATSAAVTQKCGNQTATYKSCCSVSPKAGPCVL